MLEKNILNILGFLSNIISEQKFGNSFAYSVDLSCDPTKTLWLQVYDYGGCDVSVKEIEYFFKRYRKTKKKKRKKFDRNRLPVIKINKLSATNSPWCILVQMVLNF